MDEKRLLSIIIILLGQVGLIVGDGRRACGPDQPLELLLSRHENDAGNVSSYRDPQTGLYPPNSKCSWIIKAPPGERIRVHFVELEIEPAFDCGMDALLIYHGLDLSRPGAVLCGKTPPSDVISENNVITLVFYSDSIRQFRGFELVYSRHREKEACAKDETRCKNEKCVSVEKICDKVDDCHDGTDEERCGFRPPKAKCGRPMIKPQLSDERIVGGTPAIPGSWPWQISLRLKAEEPYGHRCGASILNSQWIVTAAHCFNGERNATKWSLKIAKYNKIETDNRERTRYLDKLIIHPKYVSPFERRNWATVQDKSNDIALIKTNAPLTLNELASPVCLPSFKHTKKGLRFAVTGWGETMGTGHETVLKQAAIPLVSNKSCRKLYQGRYDINDDMICAGYQNGGVDACKGDSGGPLVTYKGKRWYLMGVVSFGGDCGRPNQPGVYTNVRNYVKWISQTLKKHS